MKRIDSRFRFQPSISRELSCGVRGVNSSASQVYAFNTTMPPRPTLFSSTMILRRPTAPDKLSKMKTASADLLSNLACQGAFIRPPRYIFEATRPSTTMSSPSKLARAYPHRLTVLEVQRPPRRSSSERIGAGKNAPLLKLSWCI